MSNDQPIEFKLRIPSSFELAKLIRYVALEWTNLPAIHNGRPSAGPTDRPLERSVAIPGPFQGLLNLRCNPNLASAHDFEAFCSMVAGHLATRYLDGHVQDFNARDFVDTCPLQWPEAEPELEILMMIGSHPLEVRLWLEQ